ncbi:hypothetical protein CTAYLR_003974 [Chrysophaeum taylorii]|uniref:Thioredoxin domain-containing protein n=1 Tax=Chrysophaeum taylorii TaxID=2483200 RepID=A0AAD7UDW6_9STRA|nr:hypothetical protein CTAYLR_003974 [Chrysophaeum taylorii]
MMICRVLLLLFFFFVVAGAILEEGVLVLKSGNFENRINERFESGIMVMFYAPWCGHCQKFKPEYEDAAQLLAEEGTTLAKIDAVEHKDIATKYEIASYPTFKWFKAGRVVDLQITDEESVLSAARRLREEKCKPIEDFDQAANATGVRVVGFFKSPKTKQAKIFLRVADEFRYPIEFFVGKSELKTTAAERTNMTTMGQVVMLKPYDEDATTNVKDKKQLTRWLEREMMPIVVPFLPEYQNMIFSGPVQMHCIIALDEGDVLPSAYYEVAKQNRGKVLHVVMVKAEDAEDIWEFFKIETTPTVVMSDMTEVSEANPRGIQVKFQEELTVENLAKFEEPYAARMIARRAGLDPKMAEIMAEPKLQEMLKDPKMGTMFQIMGMPKKLVDIYRSAEL